MSKDYFQHELAVIETEKVGKDTRTWAFAHILPSAKVGSNCNICDHTFIENDVILGNNVTIKCGVYLWDPMRVEDDVFIGPNESTKLHCFYINLFIDSNLNFLACSIIIEY